MKINDMMMMGLRNLFRRKARTSLTIVGMSIGIVLIMVLASISIGVNQTINDYIMENGAMSIIEISGWTYEENESTGMWERKKQEMDERVLNTIKGINHVRAVTPVYEDFSITLKSGKYEMDMWALMAIDFAVFEDFGFPSLEDGSYPSKDNYRGIVFGANAIREFGDYSGRTPKYKEVDIVKDKITFTFRDYNYQIDWNKKADEYFLENVDMLSVSDDYMHNMYAYIDIEYYKELFLKFANGLKPVERKKAIKSLDQYGGIRINVDNIKYVTQVEEEINALGYETYSQMQYIQPLIDTADMLQKILIGIGLVAMLVSAINIANTMIMSIYERTREIGIMKVLGSLVTDIKKMFLFESAILGLIGGWIGIGLSYLASFVINKFGTEFLGNLIRIGAESGSKASVIPWWLPLVMSGFAIVVGVISGYIPARRATKISAIEAMKSE